MSEEQQVPVVHVPWYRQQLTYFIILSIVIAFMLVVVGMILYVSSGAAQLDLSRPGYQSVQSKVDQSDSFQSFSATGPVNGDTIDQFQKLYKSQVRSVDGTDAFSTDALGDQSLGIDDPGADQ